LTLWRGSEKTNNSIVTAAMTTEVTDRKDLQAAELLAVAADPIRWTLLNKLAAGGSCVCKLREQVPIAANLLSYHLRVLREAGLVTASRRGRLIDYALAPDALDRLHAALPGAIEASPVP
jgi:ArsR family transcriptional regulator